MIKTELKGKLVGILLIALIVTSMFSGAVASEKSLSASSLLENSGFESGVLYPWYSTHSSTSGPDFWVAIGADDERPYEGEYGAYISIYSDENEWGRIIQEIEIIPGEGLTLEAELMYELDLETGYAELWLVFLDNDMSSVGSVHEEYYESDFGDEDNWIHVALPETTAPSNAKYVRVMVGLADVENCVLNIDNVILQSDRGSLTVNVENAEGQPMPSCGGTIDVKLYDPFQVRSKPYSGGESYVQVQFDNLANKQYPLEAYHTPNTGLGLEEYWGGDTVTVSGPTPKDFVRHTQVAYDVTINGKDPHENEIEVNAGEQVHVDVTVKNFEGGTSSKNVEARLILDRDNSSSYDFDETHGPVSIPQNDVEVFGYDFYPEEAGTYYFYIVVKGEYSSKYIVVDQHDWYKAYDVTNSPPVLSEPDPGGANNGGTINSLSGTTSTEFIFSVIYSDADNDAPYRHWLKLKRTAPDVEYFKYNMDTSDPTPDYTAGVLYTNTTTLEPGTYEYWFDFKDYYNPDVLLPPTYPNYLGPTVIPEAAWISILDISTSNTLPDPGETITLSVSTRNDGADGYADIGMTVIDPSGDECDLQWKEREYYTAGQPKTLYFSYEVPSEGGWFEVISKSWDDCYGDCGSEQCCDPTTCTCSGVQDELPKTNAFKLEIPEGPDLTLSSGDISFSNFNPSVGESITITAVIHNIGNADAHAVIVQFFDGDPDNGGTQIGDNRIIDFIAVDKSEIAQIDWIFSSVINVYAVVDPDNDITELDEGNNVANRVVSGALSPEANLDILRKLVTYYEESESYVSDNWATAERLCDISLTDKEREEILNELAKKFPELDITEDELAEEITNFQQYINNVIAEDQTIIFTKTDNGTNLTENGIKRSLDIEIPVDKIELKSNSGKCLVIVNTSGDTQFTIIFEPFERLEGTGIETTLDLDVTDRDVEASLYCVIFVGPGLISPEFSPGIYVQLDIDALDHTYTIIVNDPISFTNAEVCAGVYVGYDVSGYSPVLIGAGAGVDVGAFACYIPLDIEDPSEASDVAIEDAERLSGCLSDSGGPKEKDPVEEAIHTGLEVIEEVSNSLPPRAKAGVECGAQGKLGLGVPSVDVAGGTEGSIGVVGAISASMTVPINIYGDIISENKEELTTFYSSSIQALPIIMKIYDASQHPSITNILDACAESPQLAKYVWTACNSGQKLQSKDYTEDIMICPNLGVGIGADVLAGFVEVGGRGQLSGGFETNLKTLIAASTLDYSTLWNEGYAGGMITEGVDVSGGVDAGLSAGVKAGLSKDLYKVSVQGKGGSTSALQGMSVEGLSELNVSDISDYGVDTNGDGLYDYLAVDMILDVNVTDDYAMGGMLFRNLTCVGSVINTTSLDVGRHNITFKFDGISLRNQEVNGSYEFGFVLGSESENETLFVSFSLYNTSHYNYTEFQRSYLNITDISYSGIDTTSNGLYDYLDVKIDVNSTREDKAKAMGILVGENCVLENVTSSNLTVGTSTLELLFDGEEIRSGGSDAYNVDITVYNEKGVVLDSFTSDITLSYQNFELPNATFSDIYADSAVDTDGDGLYDYLIVDVGVNVSVPGEYSVDAYLLGNRTVFSLYNSTFLDSDNPVSLLVDGLFLRSTLKNQKYALINVRLWQNNTLLAVRSHPYNTSTYNYNSFKRPKAWLTNNYSDQGIDTDGDVLYDYLGVDVELNVTDSGVYKIAGFLKCNQSSVSAEKQITLEAGHHTATLLFDGEEIYSKGYNGEYQLEGVRIIQNGEYLDYINETYNTSIYNYTDFEIGESPSVDIPISTAEDSQLCPTITYNPTNNEYLVTWYDYRRTGEEPDIYAQRVSGENNLIGGNFAIALSSGTDVKELYPFVTYNPTNNEYIVVWNEKNGYHNLYYIYAQRLSNTGSLLGSKITVSSGGVRVRKFIPSVAYNPDNNEYLIVWYGLSAEREPSRIYGQRLSGTGSLLGSNFAIGGYIGVDNFQYYPQVAYNSQNDEYLVVWEDMRNTGGADIFAQKVSHSGSLLDSNFHICNATNAQEVPAVAYNSDDIQYLAVWQDRRNDNGDIHAQRISDAGNLLGSEIVVRVGSGTSLNPSVTYNSMFNVYFVTWEEDGDIFAQAISSNGDLNGSSSVICAATGTQSQPSVVYNSVNNRYFVTWHDYRNGNADIYGAWTAPRGSNQSPVASFTFSPSSATVGETVTFDASSSYDPDGEDITNYKWDFGDGNVTNTTGAIITHSYASTGDCVVNLTVTDDDGATNTTSRIVSVNPANTLKANFTVNNTCFCTNVTFEDNTTGGIPPYTYRWDFDNDGTYELEGGYPNPTWHYDFPGTYTARLNVTDNNDYSDETTKQVTVYENPIVNFVVSAVCYCSDTVFVDISIPGDGEIVSWFWEFGDGDTAYGQNINHHYPAPGVYVASLTVTDEYGCMNTTSTYVSVYENPIADFIAPPVYFWEDTQFTSVVTGGTLPYHYSWDFDNDGTYELDGDYPNPTWHYPAAGIYNATLNVVDAFGCSDMTTKMVEVYGVPSVFDTGSPSNPYPSISGMHNGTITPNQTINISKLYTYPCPGTGGHTESIELYENGIPIANGTWNGYVSDWHNITIHNITTGAPYIMLLKDYEYNYTIRTGSYPQIIHAKSKDALAGAGTITCDKFIDANGKEYTDWIPAIRLWA